MSYPRRFRPRRLLRLARWSGLAALALGAWIHWPVDRARLAPPVGDEIVLLARDGSPLRATRADDGSRRRWLPLAEIDPDLLVAFVAAEDRRFYEHHGVDPAALLRATRQNLAARRVVSGASTVTMQLARLVTGSSRSWSGKVSQGLWALRLDRQLTKQEILEQYLNRVPLGQGAVGVDAAARLYFGMPASDVSLAQAAMLAGLAHAPSRDNPLVSLPRAEARRNRVLDRLESNRLALPGDLARARLEPAHGAGSTPRFLAPHFTSWLLRRADTLRSLGTVRTSLDPMLEQAVEAEVRHTVAQMRSYGAEHAAAVVLENRTGEILAWVGSPDFFAAEAGQVDMVVSARQPGSTLKPFLYGLALDQGYTAASILADVSTVYPTANGPYAPRNYDRRYRGPVRFREALASSYNVPTVGLASAVGVAPLLATLHRAGFASLTRRPDHYGLGLALGNGDVTLLELANAYRALANGGVWRPVGWRATDGGPAQGEAVRVISTEAAVQILDILADPIARLPGFGPSTPLEFPFPAAAKTGTSRHFTDNWAVATTAGFTVAVWVGNFSGRPLQGASGITGAGPLLQRAVTAVAARYAPGVLPTPADLGLIPVEVCRLSGGRAGNGCPALTEWFVAGREPLPDTWYTDAGVRLPPEYVEWASRSLAGNAVVAAGIVRVSTDSAVAGFRITSPRHGDRYRFVPGVDTAYATVGLRAAGGSVPIRWYVDGVETKASRLPLTVGTHRIRAVSGSETDQVVIDVVQ
ncbi:MAG: penicillin-binding protein 1C [Gemmatimonadales bacterium]|nr:penicillin-binding protein 1C [Gemmatimonadales bacterium]